MEAMERKEKRISAKHHRRYQRLINTEERFNKKLTLRVGKNEYSFLFFGK